MKLSILIPTIPERKAQFTKLVEEVYRQIQLYAEDGEVEVIRYETPMRSKGGPTISTKRNYLISLAHGKFLWMIDDDDWIHPEAIKHILDGITTHNNAVCISHEIEVVWPNGKRELAEIRNSYENWDHKPAGKFAYRQPPYYKIPIRRDAYQGCKFRENQRWGEDGDISRQLRKNMKGKPELHISMPLYVYHMPVNVNSNTRY